jgi:hypothetical protein
MRRGIKEESRGSIVSFLKNWNVGLIKSCSSGWSQCSQTPK